MAKACDAASESWILIRGALHFGPAALSYIRPYIGSGTAREDIRGAMVSRL